MEEEETWKTTKREEDKISSREYSIGVKGRVLQLKLKTEKMETLTFLIKGLLIIKQRNRGDHPIHVEWSMHKVHYSLHVNKISFMNKLLSFNRLSPIVAKSRQNTSSANSSAYLSRDLRIGAYPIALEWAVFKE